MSDPRETYYNPARNWRNLLLIARLRPQQLAERLANFFFQRQLRCGPSYCAHTVYKLNTLWGSCQQTACLNYALQQPVTVENQPHVAWKIGEKGFKGSNLIILHDALEINCSVLPRVVPCAGLSYYRARRTAVHHVFDRVGFLSPIRRDTKLTMPRQHDVIPEDKRLREEISHVIIAFMRSELFNVEPPPSDYPLFTSVEEVREKFPATTKVLVAIGGWGNSMGFEDAARDAASRSRWSTNVKHMVETTGADGVDIDWEYPG